VNILLQCSCETTTETDIPFLPGLPITGMGGALGSGTMLWFWMCFILLMVTISVACAIWLLRRSLD
jgi:hypothetical protein